MSLAVVIPAYKGSFLGETLLSLVQQTEKGFTVYIGNDNSPDNLESIIEGFIGRLNIIYKKFPQNMGKCNLTGQWQRCIDMVRNEEWIWLLPDDDVASPECVKTFFRAIEENKDEKQLYRFQTCFIDENNHCIKPVSECPPIESNVDFLMSKLRFERISSVAEYIFSKNQFDRAGGFKQLPLAWGSDDLLWISLSQEKDIVTLTKGIVSLRQSSLNISNSKKYGKEKLISKYLFIDEILKNKTFIQKLLTKYTWVEFRSLITFHLFCEYKSHQTNFLNLNLFRYAVKNNRMIGGGVPRNIYRLLRFQIRNSMSK